MYNRKLTVLTNLQCKIQCIRYVDKMYDCHHSLVLELSLSLRKEDHTS